VKNFLVDIVYTLDKCKKMLLYDMYLNILSARYSKEIWQEFGVSSHFFQFGRFLKFETYANKAYDMIYSYTIQKINKVNKIYTE